MIEVIGLVLLGIAAWSDFRTFIIPPWIHYAFSVLITLKGISNHDFILPSFIIGVIIWIAIIRIPIISKYMGGGDTKLIMIMGFFLGNITWLYWIGLSHFIFLIHSKIDKRKHLPFGIDLFFGYLVLFLFQL